MADAVGVFYISTGHAAWGRLDRPKFAVLLRSLHAALRRSTTVTKALHPLRHFLHPTRWRGAEEAR